MTVYGHDSVSPQVERTFAAVRTALPGANLAAFDAELEAITHAPVVDLAAPAGDASLSHGAVMSPCG